MVSREGRTPEIEEAGLRKLSYFIGMSLDGYIAGPDDEVQFLLDQMSPAYFAYLKSEWPETMATAGRRHFGFDGAENTRFDTVLMGRASYALGLKDGVVSPYAHLRQYVVSRSLTRSPDPAVELVPGDPVAKVRELKERDGLGIWLCGGGNLAGQLAEEIDELVIKTYPVLAGAGIRVLDGEFTPRQFELVWSRSFDNGAVVSKYARKR
ncbi:MULTISPECIES: dihydrofolate reductase family protein [unclassified Streptomyces]|uniref:dihydrofolate reductase family protein n=1 Tax=unclassified Streptomyces TaxID=2593676 RepID=UPI003806A580